MRAQRVSLLALGCLSRIRAPRPAESYTRTKDKNNQSNQTMHTEIVPD